MTVYSAVAVALTTLPVIVSFAWIFAGLGVSLAVGCGLIGHKAMSIFDEEKIGAEEFFERALRSTPDPREIQNCAD